MRARAESMNTEMERLQGLAEGYKVGPGAGGATGQH